METTSQKRKSLLKLFIICAIGGSIFDLSQFISSTGNTEAFQNSQLFLKDLMYIGLSGLFFIQTPYSQLKLKTFGFMLISWRITVLFLNVSGLYLPKVIIVLYAIYILWIVRIYMMKSCLDTYENMDALKNTITYNIFIPVHSFRGLIQALVLMHRDPRYETTILVISDTMYYVKNKEFKAEKKSVGKIEGLINKTHAKIKVSHIPPKRKRQINKLLYKRAITGFKDCSKLKI